jgi:glycerol-3-phosphate dehydrogenase
MAQKLVDVIMRRTELGSCGHPGDAGLQKCADIVAAEMGWSRSRIDRELAEARALFPSVDYQNLPTPCTPVSMPHPG